MKERKHSVCSEFEVNTHTSETQPEPLNFNRNTESCIISLKILIAPRHMKITKREDM